jgi:hypothetical protein
MRSVGMGGGTAGDRRLPTSRGGGGGGGPSCRVMFAASFSLAILSSLSFWELEQVCHSGGRTGKQLSAPLLPGTYDLARGGAR